MWTWWLIVLSTAPCAMALPWRWPSSASRQVPSAPPNPLVPQAYSSSRCSPLPKNVTMMYRLVR